jgi:hypothetical protein
VLYTNAPLTDVPLLHKSLHNNLVMGPVKHIGTDEAALRLLTCDWEKNARKLLSRMVYGTRIHTRLQHSKTTTDTDVRLYIDDGDKAVFRRLLQLHLSTSTGKIAESTCRHLLATAVVDVRNKIG